MQKDLFLSIPIEDQIVVMHKKLAACLVGVSKIVFGHHDFTQNGKNEKTKCCHYTFIIDDMHEIKMTYICSTQKVSFHIFNSTIFDLLAINNYFIELSDGFRTVLDDYGMNSLFKFLRQSDTARNIDPVAIESDLNSDEYCLNGYFHLIIDHRPEFVNLTINPFKKDNIFSCRYSMRNNNKKPILKNKIIHNDCAYSLIEQCFYDIYLKKTYNVSRRTKNNLMLIKMQAH